MSARTGTSLACAGAALAIAFAWQALTAACNYRGDWSAFFHTGAFVRVPPAVELERVHRFEGGGYDGQYYHAMAHDPLLTRGYDRYVDNPRMRWRRILVPGLAWLLALGNDDYVDSLYLTLILASVFAGAWWLSRWSVAEGLSPFLGLGFLLLPATLTSIDRGTVDIALAALAMGFVTLRGWPRLLVLGAAPLARETGALLAIAGRHWSDALALIPSLAWWTWVALRTAPDQLSHVAPVPFAGMAFRLLHPVVYPVTTTWVRKAAALDYAALLGVCAAILLVVVRPRWKEPEWRAAAAFAVALAFVNHPQVWAEAYAFGRIATPMLLMLALTALRHRWWWGLAPLALVLPRLLFQLLPQWRGIIG